MELKVNEYKLPEAISFNFEELKTQIAAKTEQYTKIVYTDDNIKAAKEDRADLNRLKKALNDERLRRQREYLAPFEQFKKQIDEVIAIIDKPVQAIDVQIKQYEAIKQDEKKMKIQELFDSMLFPDFVKLDEKIFNPKWLNATVTMKQIEDSLQETKTQIIANCQTLAGLPSYSHEAVIYYQRTLDMAGALGKVRELSEIETAKKKMIEEETKSAEPAPTSTTPLKCKDEGQWIAFEALLTSETALKLKTFLENNNITFRPIRKGEN